MNIRRNQRVEYKFTNEYITDNVLTIRLFDIIFLSSSHDVISMIIRDLALTIYEFLQQKGGPIKIFLTATYNISDDDFDTSEIEVDFNDEFTANLRVSQIIDELFTAYNSNQDEAFEKYNIIPNLRFNSYYHSYKINRRLSLQRV